MKNTNITSNLEDPITTRDKRPKKRVHITVRRKGPPKYKGKPPRIEIRRKAASFEFEYEYEVFEKKIAEIKQDCESPRCKKGGEKIDNVSIANSDKITNKNYTEVSEKKYGEVIRAKDCPRYLSVSKSTYHNLRNPTSPYFDKLFPPVIKLGMKSRGHLKTSLDDWLNYRMISGGEE